MAEREVKQWITVNGQHVPIYEGQSKADAVKKAIDGQKKGKKSDGKIKGNFPVSKDKGDEHDQELTRAMQLIEKHGYVETGNAEIASQYKLNKNYDVVKQGNGAYRIIKKTEVNTDNATGAKTHKDLESKLKEKGLSLESADSHTMQNSNSLNGEKVTMYDKDGNEYQGTYNKYSDGGREIVDIKKTKSSEKSSKKSQLDKDEEVKAKQIAQNKAQADKLNGKGKAPSLTDKQTKVAKKSLDNIMWKNAIDGEQSAEISSDHWGWAGMSNDKMVKVLNAYDNKHEYRVEKVSEKKKIMGQPTTVNHYYLVRDKK